MNMNMDKEKIRELLINYAIALDSRSWLSLNNIFHKDATASYGSEAIEQLYKPSSRDEIINMCKQSLGGCGPTQHLLSNFRITTNPNSNKANSKCYVRAFHAGMEPNENEYYEMFGEYQDELQKFDNDWMIVKRQLRVDLEKGNRDKVLAPGTLKDGF